MDNNKAPQPSAALSFCAPGARRGVLFAAILASALGFIDGTVVSIALPAMRDSLDATLAQAQWFSNSYMLFLSALILAGGAMGDRFGLARVFSLGIGVFIAASLACALAPTAEFMIAGRALKGIGAALMVPGSLALISRAYPREARAAAIGTWAAASALTTALGPIIGGLVLTLGGPDLWRWIFAINLPLGLLALVILWRAVENDPSQSDAPVDWVGAGLATAGLGAMAYALTSLNSGGPALPAAIASLVLLTAFIAQEGRHRAPMMPLTLFRNPAFSAANAATFLLYAGLGAMLFFLPMTVITAWGVTPIEASAAFAPLSVFISTLSTPVGRWSDRHGPERIISIGAAVVALAYAGAALTAFQTNFWGTIFPAMVLAGFGMALVVAPLSAAVMAAVDDAQTGVASGVNNAVSRISSLVAIAAFGSLAAWRYSATGGSASFGENASGTAHIHASTAAFSTICWAASVLALASSVAIMFTRKPAAVD